MGYYLQILILSLVFFYQPFFNGYRDIQYETTAQHTDSVSSAKPLPPTFWQTFTKELTWETFTKEFEPTFSVFKWIFGFLAGVVLLAFASKQFYKFSKVEIRDILIFDLGVASVVATVFLVGLIIHEPSNASHILVEMFIIFSIALFILVIKVSFKHYTFIRRSERLESSTWSSYMTRINSTQTSLSAICTSDFRLFFQPLGMRYLIHQIDVVLEKQKAGTPINASRIVVVDNYGIASILDTWVGRAIRNDKPLTDDERLFKIFVYTHLINGVKLFFVTRTEFLSAARKQLRISNSSFIEYPHYVRKFNPQVIFLLKCRNRRVKKIGIFLGKLGRKTMCFHDKKITKMFDKLVIDTNCYYVDDKDEKQLLFSDDNTFKVAIAQLTAKFSTHQYSLTKLMADLNVTSVF